MSHSHTHASGQNPGHTHGPPPPQQPQMVMRQPDPVMQALIEASFRPVDIALGPPENASALCGKHSLEKCAECDVDYTSLNRLSRTLQANPNLRCPPPPQVISKPLSAAINNTKEEGNALFKAGMHDKAIQRYSMAANIAAQRPPWEAQQIMREELSTILSNRSAAFLEAGDYINALVDAELVIQIRRPWSKGHYRQAKALLGLNRFDEARNAVQVGLSFEPDSKELRDMLNAIDAALQRMAAAKHVQIEEKTSNGQPA